jgi:hypothetical protein
MFCWSPLQTRSGHLAKKLTADEFDYHFQRIRSSIEKYAADHPGELKFKIMFSYDFATCHKDSAAARNLADDEKAPIAAKSFDIQKIVEHAHHLIKGAYRRELQMADLETSRDDLVAMFKDIVKANVLVGPIRKDVDSLPGTYRAILQAEGYYPGPGFR